MLILAWMAGCRETPEGEGMGELVEEVTEELTDPDPDGKRKETPIEELTKPLEEVGEVLTGSPDEPGSENRGADPAVETEPEGPLVAKPVPDKPGFVISPFSGKWIDVSGIPPGTLVADPHFPAEEKKHFRVPEPAPPAEASAEGSAEEPTTDSGERQEP